LPVLEAQHGAMLFDFFLAQKTISSVMVH